MPTKLGVHTFHIYLFMHEFLGWFNFLIPMDYSQRKFSQIWKGAKSLKPDRPSLTNLVLLRISSTSTCTSFLGWFYYLTPMEYSPLFERKIWPNLKGAKSPNLERPCPPNLACMHFTSTSTCMIYWADFIFFEPMDYSPLSERKIWPNLKGAKSPKPERPCAPTLVCMHFTSTSTSMNLLGWFYFLTPMDYNKKNLAKFEKVSKTGEAKST